MTQPLLVHVLFHPESTSARACAQELYRTLNSDPALPGLRVPVMFAPERSDHAPPAEPLDLDSAERNFVIVLADVDMDADEGWCGFIGDQWERCAAKATARMVPLQLSEHAWPLDPRLEHTNFGRAWAQEEGHRQRWIASRVVLELFRFLADEASGGEKAPVQLFLSHAKADLGSGPRAFEVIAKYLDAKQPVRAWIDSADIPGGSRFDQEIAAGVQDSALLVILTDNYSTRSWCRREVLLAKEKRRPLVVLDVLQDMELRSFPYLGNVPVVRWSATLAPEQTAARAVDLVIKEALRQRVTTLWLEAVEHDDDLVLASPPELINLRHVAPKRTILYPDPPLATEEFELLDGLPLGEGPLRLETPMQRRLAAGGLAGKLVALSTSETADLASAGLFAAHFDDALLTISRELLLRGAKLAYGGHLGKEGYTRALFELAQAYRSRDGIPPVEKIVNYVGWPLGVSKQQKSQFKNQASFVRVPRPDGVADLEPETFVDEPSFFQDDSPARRYAWARGMTAMREQQTKDAAARIIIGGLVGPTLGAVAEGGVQLKWYKSRIPGVLEELLLSLERRQPVYLVGAFGGVGRLAVDLIEGRTREEMRWEFQRGAPHADEMRKLYERRGDGWLGYDAIAKTIADAGVEGLANGLSPDENRTLWTSRDIEQIAALIIQGLLRLFPRDGD